MNTTTFMITTFLALWILFITTMLLWLVHQHFALSTELASVPTKNTALLAAIEAQRWRQPPAPTRCNHVIHDEMASYHLDSIIARLMCLELANAKAQHDKLAALECNNAYLSRALVLACASPRLRLSCARVWLCIHAWRRVFVRWSLGLTMLGMI
jgi:hypothetical protein